MYFVSGVCEDTVYVTDSFEGITESFSKTDLELFIRSGNAVLGAVQGRKSGRLSTGYYFVPVTLESERQVREEVNFGYEYVRSNLKPETLYDFMVLYNFKSQSEEHCSEFLVLTYLLQAYDSVTLVVQGKDMYLTIPFEYGLKTLDYYMTSFRIRGETYRIGKPKYGYLDGNSLKIGYISSISGFTEFLTVDLGTLAVDVSGVFLSSGVW